MANLKKEIEYTTPSEMIDFILGEHTKSLYISIPAIVQSYDKATRRCSALPAIKVAYEDSSEEQMPIINDVPVLMPAGGGYSVTMPINSGDSVLLCFCHRGIEKFKESFKLSSPTLSIIDLHDAVAIAGFGDINITPASQTGATIQSNDGANAIIIESDKVVIKKGGNSIDLSDSSMLASVSGATLSLSASSLVSSVPIEAPGFSGGSGAAASMPSGLITGSAVVGGVELAAHTHSDPQGGTTGPAQ